MRIFVLALRLLVQLYSNSGWKQKLHEILNRSDNYYFLGIPVEGLQL